VEKMVIDEEDFENLSMNSDEEPETTSDSHTTPEATNNSSTST
jgi:hypothetical protein